MWGDSGNLLLRLSHNQEEVAAYNEAVEKGEDDLPDVTCYVRVGQPRIVYGISESVYDQLTAVSYDTLCRQKLFAADFDAVTSIDVALNGENYSGVPINAEKKLRVKEEYDMNPNSTTYQAYVQILKEELLPAMGCTEPIAIAYCAARARAMLGALPDAIEVEASGNIIKNVKSVVVPNTEGRKGLEAAAAIGVLGGDADNGYEVIASISSEVKKQLGPYLEATPIMVRPANSDYVLDVSVLARSGEHYALVRAVNEHTNIVRIEKDAQVLLNRHPSETMENENRALLNIRDIYDFAKTADLDDVRDVLSQQIRYNSAISAEGLRGDYGANIGRTLLRAYGSNVRIRARAAAAAGSDARMNGCEMPVVLNSGSGNQGMTASLPVIEYARELGSSEDELYRALLVSNLVTLHQKTGIGRLSAYCGAVSAGAGAGAGIAFLCGADYATVAHTVINAVAVTSGIVCDGAKASCAGKISVAVDAGIMGYEMCLTGNNFHAGDGILADGVENTIKNVGRLGRVGMRDTDREIMKIMTGN